MLTAFLGLLAVSSFQDQLHEQWEGEFVFTISGTGRASGPSPNFGTWNINREAKGKIVLAKSFRGGGIAGTKDTNNLKRYETWIADAKLPIQIQIHDSIVVYGPLFSASNIRNDTTKVDCPPLDSKEKWQIGKVASSILQFDERNGSFEFESPRIYGKAQHSFSREFVKGPSSWTKKEPILNKSEPLEYEMIHDLNQPKEWFFVKGKYKVGQKEVVLTRELPITVPLGASIKAQNLKAKFVLVLKKVPKPSSILN